MKKLVIFALLTLFSVANLAPNMQGLQLVKIPTLLDHVETHFGSEWSWNEFKTFVSDHYANAKLPQDKEHEKLPFKTVVNTSSYVSDVNTWSGYTFDSASIESKECKLHYETVKSIQDISLSIWTPPKA